MSSQPKTWHYGLIARWWAEFKEGGPDVPFFQKLIEESGEPALDLGCGTGRVLLPLLRAGFTIDGCDISADMLALCREKASREGFEPALYNQAMHELDLPRQYGTVIIPGSFGLSGDPKLDQQTLKRIYAHLLPGGTLAFDIDVEFHYAESWQGWLKEERDKLPEAWPEFGEARVAADGSEYRGRIRTLALDPLEQVVTREMQMERWLDGKLVESETGTLRTCIYFKNEAVLMMEMAGFQDVQVTGDYSDEEATADHEKLVLVGHKG